MTDKSVEITELDSGFYIKSHGNPGTKTQGVALLDDVVKMITAFFRDDSSLRAQKEMADFQRMQIEAGILTRPKEGDLAAMARSHIMKPTLGDGRPWFGWEGVEGTGLNMPPNILETDLVEVRLRGETEPRAAKCASMWTWEHFGGLNDIVLYRRVGKKPGEV